MINLKKATIRMKPLLVIIMGVSGSGKSTLATNLANTLKAPFLEADDFHSREAKAMMSQGIPLTDELREPWISQICGTLNTLKPCNQTCILAYSGLKKAHREKINALGFNCVFLHMKGNLDLITQRLESRTGHFMSTELLQSQFDAMEEPNDSQTILIDISKSEDEILRSALEHLEEYLRDLT